MRHLNEYLLADESNAVEVFVERLLTDFGQEVTEIRLFGSKARGEAGPDSDLDILVLVKDTEYALKHTILWLAAEVSLNHDVLLSPRVIPISAWQTMSEGDALFYRTVCTDSIPLSPTRSVEIGS